MKLYVANCTHQIQTVNYRLVEAKGRGFSTQHIDVGRQIQIALDLNRPQIDFVIEQLAIYGLHSVEDARENTTRYVPLIYSIDKFVQPKVMEEVIDRNRILLREMGSKLRREAAIATSHGMRQYTPNAADHLQMSVEEEKPGTMDHNGDPAMAEGYRMSRDAMG